ncbi:hypothetical protein QQ045_009902 [Rhodiola kirilowii]
MASSGNGKGSKICGDVVLDRLGVGRSVDDPYDPVDLVMRAKWQRCNDVIMSWLICSVSEKIVGEILHANDVMIAWKDLESSYAGTNLVRKSALLRELSALVQNGMPMVDDKQEERVVKFLMGLDECYASIRTNVFSMTEVPKMVTVYGLVLTEESTRKATKERQVEASALFTQSNQSGYNQVSQARGRDINKDTSRGGFVKGKGRMFYTHCQIHGHLKENYYKFVGYPQNVKF